MAKKQWGDFPDAFGSDDKIFTGGELAKAVDPDDIDLEKMCEAMEILNNRARRMNKAQLYRLNYKLGLAVNRFREEVQKYITRPRESIKEETLRKVGRTANMNDAGLDELRKTPIPRTGARFTKVDHPGGDMSDSGLGDPSDK